MAFEQLKLKNQLCHRLYMASNKIIRSYKDYLDPLDLTYPQYVVMMALWEFDNIKVSRLIELTQIDGGSLTLILKKLIKKGFISESKDSTDKRSKVLSLTSSGKSLKKSAASIPKRLSCEDPKLSPKEAYQLALLLDKYLDLNRD